MKTVKVLSISALLVSTLLAVPVRSQTFKPESHVAGAAQPVEERRKALNNLFAEV